MSIHLQSVPIPLGMNPITYFRNMAGPGAKVAKVTTDVTDYNLMQDILSNNSLGFKSKLDLMNFQRRCVMYFEDNGHSIDITFIGSFTHNEIRTLVYNLNHEFNNILHPTNVFNNNFNENIDKIKKENEKNEKKTRERLTKKQEYSKKSNSKNNNDKIKPIKVKKEKVDSSEVIEDKSEKEIDIEETVIPENQFIISSNLKDKSIINQVLDESYVGYNSKEELEKFQNIGKISFNKTINETFDFVFIGDYNKEEAEKYVENITEEYALIVQEQTYLKVMEKIKKENLTLESEIVDSNDSIVLTINI